MHGQPETERRRQRRVALKLPVRVQGRDADGADWDEMSTCEDASIGGVGLFVSHPVRPGQVLHLSVPLPPRFRQYDLNDSSYRTYALVRHTKPTAGALRVGVLFLGRHPPRGAEFLPSELYLMPGERAVRRARPATAFRLRLEAEQAPGAVERQETVVAEDLGPRMAVVRTTRLPLGRGTVLAVEEKDGEFHSRAEVSSISIGADGQPRVTLTFLDDPVPDRLLSRADAPPEG
jgi:PilZ domain